MQLSSSEPARLSTLLPNAISITSILRSWGFLVLDCSRLVSTKAIFYGHQNTYKGEGLIENEKIYQPRNHTARQVNTTPLISADQYIA